MPDFPQHVSPPPPANSANPLTSGKALRTTLPTAARLAANRFKVWLYTKPRAPVNRLAVLALAASLTGCAVAPPNASYSLIDPYGVDMVRYHEDHAQCAGLAEQTDVGASAAGGAVIGALFGAVIGAALCGRDCAATGAAWGAASGATSGAGGGVREQGHALRACLSGRGYVVIR